MVIGVPTQPGTGVAVKDAVGPVYTRIGEIVASELSHKLIAFILKVKELPAPPHDDSEYV
jgi:hypothetical protein